MWKGVEGHGDIIGKNIWFSRSVTRVGFGAGSLNDEMTDGTCLCFLSIKEEKL